MDILALVPSEDDVPSLVAEDSVPSLGLQVYDAGGTEFGTTLHSLKVVSLEVVPAESSAKILVRSRAYS